MNTTVKTLALNYETLAKQTVSLNNSYLALLNIYNEANLQPELLKELENKATSPLKVIAAMSRDREKLLSQFSQLADSIAAVATQFTQDPESTELKAIDSDRQVMQDLVVSLDLPELEQMLVALK